MLESGGTRPYELATGWLGRALAASGSKGLALNTTVPLVLRGRADVDTWAPSVLPDPSADLVARLERMYAGDPALATALERARQLRADTPAAMQDAGAGGDGRRAARARAPSSPCRAAPPSSSPSRTGRRRRCSRSAAGTPMPTRPTRTAPLAAGLRQLDPAWRRCAPASPPAAPGSGPWSSSSASSAARSRSTARSAPTTAPAASPSSSAARSAAAGSIADWPGLAKSQRHEGRDLRITTDLRAVLKGVLGDHLQIAARSLDAEVFPDSAKVKPLPLLRG